MGATPKRERKEKASEITSSYEVTSGIEKVKQVSEVLLVQRLGKNQVRGHGST
jgi:hypothetical protein